MYRIVGSLSPHRGFSFKHATSWLATGRTCCHMRNVRNSEYFRVPSVMNTGGIRTSYCTRYYSTDSCVENEEKSTGSELVTTLKEIKQQVYKNISFNWYNVSDPVTNFKELYHQNGIKHCLLPLLKKYEPQLDELLRRATSEKDTIDLNTLSTLVLDLFQLGVHHFRPESTWDLLLTCAQCCEEADITALLSLSTVCQQLFKTEGLMWREDVLPVILARFKHLLRESEIANNPSHLISVVGVAENLGNFMSKGSLEEICGQIQDAASAMDIQHLDENAIRVITHIIKFLASLQDVHLERNDMVYGVVDGGEYVGRNLAKIVLSTLKANEENVFSLLGANVVATALGCMYLPKHSSASLNHHVFKSSFRCFEIRNKFPAVLERGVIRRPDFQQEGDQDFDVLFCSFSSQCVQVKNWHFLKQCLFRNLKHGSTYFMLKVTRLLLHQPSLLLSVTQEDRRNYVQHVLRLIDVLMGQPQELGLVLQCIFRMPHLESCFLSKKLTGVLEKELRRKRQFLSFQDLVMYSCILYAKNQNDCSQFIWTLLLLRLKNIQDSKIEKSVTVPLSLLYRHPGFKIVTKRHQAFIKYALDLLNESDTQHQRMCKEMPKMPEIEDVKLLNCAYVQWLRYVDKLCIAEKFNPDLLYSSVSLRVLEMVEMQSQGSYNLHIHLMMLCYLFHINRSAVLECPELQIPWLFGSEQTKMLLKGIEKHEGGEANSMVQNSLEYIFNGAEYIATDRSTQYLHHIDFEIQLDNSDRAIPAAAFDSSSVHKKVAVVLPHRYNSKKSSKRDLQRLRHLEILGYKVVKLFPKAFEDLNYSRTRHDFLQRAIFEEENNVVRSNSI